jgi:hypothetical protein
MLTDAEWEVISAALEDGIEQIKVYRQMNNCSLADARATGFGQQALALYKEITGFSEENPDALFHHRLSIYGPICGSCKKPLRTPQATSCAACGASRN